MTDIVIAGYKRTAFTPAYKGALAKSRPDDMAATAVKAVVDQAGICLLYTSPSPRDRTRSRMPSSA